MPRIFNQDSVPAISLGEHATRQHLINAEITSDDNVRLERWVLEEKGNAPLSVDPKDIVWVQILTGSVQLSGSAGEHALSDHHLAFLPGGFEGAVSTERGAILLYARVPEAARFDPAFETDPPGFRSIDWSEEPVLDSTHDARQRIYFVTPKLFATKAISGEMIIYPPGTIASNHHHEGAEHFQYVVSGEGIVYSNEDPHRLRTGDVVYNYEKERHYFECDGDKDFVFVEFFVPGEYKTIWADQAPICTWEPTGKNIKGGTPSRDIAAHSSQPVDTPADV